MQQEERAVARALAALPAEAQVRIMGDAAARLGRAAATVEGLLTVGGAHNGQQGKMV